MPIRGVARAFARRGWATDATTSVVRGWVERLPPGTYFWRVIATVDGSTDLLSEPSIFFVGNEEPGRGRGDSDDDDEQAPGRARADDIRSSGEPDAAGAV